MSKIFRNVILSAAAFTLAATPALADEHGDEDRPVERTKGEEKLAKLLEGRVAGEPVSCITTFPTADRMQVIGKTAIVFSRGKTVYVNYTRHPKDVDDSDILVIKRTDASRLCRLDNVTTMDRTSHIFSGVIFLDDFIPYTRTDDSAEDDAKDESTD